MGISYRPAVRSGVKLMIGLAGPSGSGKTYSALLLAQGIQAVDGGNIFVIDTENRRSEHYADYFKFMIGEMAPPFSPEAYYDAIKVAVAQGAKIIVIDSASHMHEGEGGIHDIHEAEIQKKTGGDESKRHAANIPAWGVPKEKLARFINRVLQIDAHFIFCFRAKEKIKMVKVGNKTTPVPQGMQPIASEELIYEMVLRLVFQGNADGVPDLSASATKLPEPLRAIVKPGAQINPVLGEILARWARGDTPNGTAPKAAAPEQNTNQARRPPASHGGAPDSEVPSDDPPVDGGTSHLFGYHRELAGAKDGDDLAARQEGSEHFHQLDDGERQTAREIYKLHLRRVRGHLPAEAVAAEIELLLEGVPA